MRLPVCTERHMPLIEYVQTQLFSYERQTRRLWVSYCKIVAIMVIISMKLPYNFTLNLKKH